MIETLINSLSVGRYGFEAFKRGIKDSTVGWKEMTLVKGRLEAEALGKAFGKASRETFGKHFCEALVKAFR